MRNIFSRLISIARELGLQAYEDNGMIVIRNHLRNSIIISKNRIKKNTITLDSNVTNRYSLDIQGYKTIWCYEESGKLEDFILKNLIPIVIEAKGPYQIKEKEYFDIVEFELANIPLILISRGTKEFKYPFMESLIDLNLNFQEYIMNKVKYYFFCNEGSLYKSGVCIDGDITFLDWTKFATCKEEGLESIKKLVSGTIAFGKVYES